MNLPAKRTLEQLEAIIESGLRTFVEVGEALLEIRDERLYREQGFNRFEDYCRKRWNMSQPHAQRMIDASEVAHNLIPIGITPKNEAQARELARLSPEQQRVVAGTIDFKTTTAEQIRERVQEYQSRGASPASALMSIRNEVRDQLHEKFPSPAAAREIAIKSGAHTRDWNGDFQPPMTREAQAEARTDRQSLQPLADFLQWVGADVSPEQAADIIKRRQWQSWLVGDDPTVKAAASAEFGGGWLHKLAAQLARKEKR